MRTRRVTVFAVVAIVSLAVLGVLVTTAGDRGIVEAESEDRYPGETLITVQSYDSFGSHDGEVFIVDADGDRVWEYQPGDAAVFDGEVLENGNVLVSYGKEVPNAECPAEFRDAGPENQQDHCIRNVVEEIDRETREREWAYTWYDHFVSFHEVHDADRLATGETVIADMGQHRVFTVDRSGEITWEWSAIENLDVGTEFWDEHVEGTSRDDHVYGGDGHDWTHLNDVDRRENGNFLVSIRNFDVIIEIDPETDEIDRVYGEPGNHSLMHEQHDPNYLERHDTLIVSDSENNRVVEYDAESMEEIWRYDGTGPESQNRLQWPRDADRLPNGNTLIVDSRNFRVIEVNETGSVVWAHDVGDERAIVYDADRLGPDGDAVEEPRNVPPGDDLSGRTYGDGLTATIAFVESWLGFVLPPWVGVVGLLAILGTIVSTLGLLWEGYRVYRPS